VEELRDRYESLIEREDRLLRQIQTGEICLFTLLEAMYQKDREVDPGAAKELAQRMYAYTEERRTELWQVRLEKTILAVQLKPERDKATGERKTLLTCLCGSSARTEDASLRFCLS
jgi:hypothetical protein